MKRLLLGSVLAATVLAVSLAGRSTTASAPVKPAAVAPVETCAAVREPVALPKPHVVDAGPRQHVVARLAGDPLTRPLGELMAKTVDVPREKLAASPEDIAAFHALFADPDAGLAFATRALELLPRDGFGFERGAVLAGLDSLAARGLEARVVPIMIDELEHTLPEPATGSLDLGLPQIAQRTLLRASSVTDTSAVEITARAMIANLHTTVTNALARQLVAIRPSLKDALSAELDRQGFPVESVAWGENVEE